MENLYRIRSDLISYADYEANNSLMYQTESDLESIKYFRPTDYFFYHNFQVILRTSEMCAGKRMIQFC